MAGRRRGKRTEGACTGSIPCFCKSTDLTNDGALIVGGDVAIYSKENIENIGTIKADGTVDLKGENINNLWWPYHWWKRQAGCGQEHHQQGRASVPEWMQSSKVKSITNEADVKESQYKGLNQKTVGNAGSISAGQNLSINAEKDIINKGSVLAEIRTLT